jgi:hypothetical protein
MVLSGGRIANDDELHVSFGHVGGSQRDIFGNGVILAIAAARGECFERRAPVFGDAPLRHIAGRNDRQVYGAIDDANAGAAILRATLVDDGKETPRGTGTRRPLAAAGQNFVVGANLRLDAAPPGHNRSGCEGLGV